MIESFIFWGLLFAASLFVLVKSSIVFVDNSEKIGLILGIPKFVIGATIVAMGTSLPELASSIMSIVVGNTEYVLGNVLGSSVSNLLLNMGITYLLLRQKKISWDIFNGDAIFLIGSIGLLFFTILDGKVTFVESILFLVSYVAYAYYSMMTDKKLENKRHIPKKEETEAEALLEDIEEEKPKFSWPMIPAIILSAVGIYIGARFTLKSVGVLSGLLGFDNTSVLAMTLVAIGTSLPELMVSIACVKKKSFEIALGNVIGSNIFNIFFIVGVGGIVSGFLSTTLHVSAEVINLTFPILIIGTAMLVLSRIGKKANHVQGTMFLIMYALFLLKSYNVI